MPVTYNTAMKSTGSGAAIIPDFIEARLRKALELKSAWLQFLTPGKNEAPFPFEAGIGKTITLNYNGNLDPTSGGLTSGTTIGYGTTSLSQASATIAEDGKALAAEGFQAWMTNPGLPIPANAQSFQTITNVNTLIDWSVGRFDYLVGQELLGGPEWINVDGTAASAVSSGTAAGTTGGLLTIANVDEIANILRTKGIVPRAELGNTYAWIGAPGAFASLKALSVIERDKAALGESQLNNMGYLGVYNGFTFFEAEGPYTGLTRAASGTIGTSVIIGADAVVGDTTMGNAATSNQAGFITYYPDYGQDAGRSQVVKAYWLYAVTRTVSGTSMGRVWKVRSLHQA